MALVSYRQWQAGYVVARLWWCGDGECDCTQPVIERVNPNLQAGYPWVHRENLWEGEFVTETWSVPMDERERLQFAPLRQACAEYGVPVPDDIPHGACS
jgi:hypothetical protein